MADESKGMGGSTEADPPSITLPPQIVARLFPEEVQLGSISHHEMAKALGLPRPARRTRQHKAYDDATLALSDLFEHGNNEYVAFMPVAFDGDWISLLSRLNAEIEGLELIDDHPDLYEAMGFAPAVVRSFASHVIAPIGVRDFGIDVEFAHSLTLCERVAVPLLGPRIGLEGLMRMARGVQDIDELLPNLEAFSATPPDHPVRSRAASEAAFQLWRSIMPEDAPGLDWPEFELAVSAEWSRRIASDRARSAELLKQMALDGEDTAELSKLLGVDCPAVT